MFCLRELFFILNIMQYKAQETLKTEKNGYSLRKALSPRKGKQTEDEKK